MFFYKYLIVGIIYSLFKILFVSDKTINEIQKQSRRSKNFAFGSLFVIYLIFWPFFLFFDFEILIRSIHLKYLNISLNFELKKFNKTIEKHGVDKKELFKNLGNEHYEKLIQNNKEKK